MSNGPYGQSVCRCGEVALLLCGDPLGTVWSTAGAAATCWPLAAVQLARGAADVDVAAAPDGSESWRCRHCDERLVHACEVADVAVLEDALAGADVQGSTAAALSAAQAHRLEALGYRLSPRAR